MFDMTTGPATRAAALLARLGALGLAVGACQAGVTGATGASDGPVRCEIQASEQGGMTSLEGVVHADEAVSGTYRFEVAGGGTDISQGGAFQAGPGGATSVGKVMLGGRDYEASLEVTANGARLDCDRPTMNL